MTLMARTAALVAATALLGGCSLFSSMNKLNEQDMQFRNDGVKMNLRTVSLALSMYAREHKSTYPARGAWVAELKRVPYYLPTGGLPPNPWALIDEHTQANAPALGPLPAMTDENFDVPPAGTVLGKGANPSSTLYETTTYGAVLYDVTPNRKACVLYGVGQKGDDAIVVDTQLRGRL